MKESRQEYIERMAAIAVKKNWQSGDFEWLNKHLGKNDLVADIQKRLTKRAPDVCHVCEEEGVKVGNVCPTCGTRR